LEGVRSVVGAYHRSWSCNIADPVDVDDNELGAGDEPDMDTPEVTDGGKIDDEEASGGASVKRGIDVELADEGGDRLHRSFILDGLDEVEGVNGVESAIEDVLGGGDFGGSVSRFPRSNRSSDMAGLSDRLKGVL
jgi:hypothetical protein